MEEETPSTRFNGITLDAPARSRRASRQQKRAQTLRGDGAAEQIPLHDVAAEPGETIPLQFGLDPLRDYLDRERVRHFDQRTHQRLIGRVLTQTGDERAVNVETSTAKRRR